MARKKRPRKLNAGQFVRELARERVGPVPAARQIPPKTARKKPKHKKAPEAAEDAGA